MTDLTIARARAVVEAASGVIPELIAILTHASDTIIVMLAYLITEAVGESDAALVRQKLAQDAELVERIREGFYQLTELQTTIAPQAHPGWLASLRQIGHRAGRGGLARRDYYFGTAVLLFVFLVVMFANGKLDPGGGIGIALVPIMTVMGGAIIDAVRHMAGLSITNPLTGAPVGAVPTAVSPTPAPVQPKAK